MIIIKTGVCGSIVQKTKDDIINTIKTANLDVLEYLELRVDVIDDVTSQLVGEIIEEVRDITDKKIILTNRTKLEGGHYSGSEDERMKILADNAHLVEYTDVELSTSDELIKKVVNSANKTIISYHNFKETPSIEFLEDIINKAYMFGDVAKVALKPNCMDDTYTIVKLLMRYDDFIGISMDSMGAYTRIIGPVMGAPVTYAAIDSKSAPGQLTINETSTMIKKLRGI